MSVAAPFSDSPEHINPSWFTATPQPKRNKIFSSYAKSEHADQIIDKVQRLNQKMVYIQNKIQSIPDDKTQIILGQTIKYKDLEIQNKNNMISKNRDIAKQLEQTLFRKNQQILDLNAHLYFIKHYGQTIPFQLPNK